MATPPAILVCTLLPRITPPSINGRVGRQRRTGAPALYRMPPGTSWGPTYKRGAPPILGVSPMAWFIAQSGPHIQASISKIECITTFFAQISAQKETGQESQPDSQAAVEKKDEDWEHDCTIDIVSPHQGSCITRHTYLIGSLWRVLISSCESHRRCCGGENRRKHRHLSTSTTRSHPLPRQLLQSNIWAHPQQYSAQIARTKELSRKNS